MRLCRYNDNRVGLVAADGVCDVTAIAEQAPLVRWPLPMGDWLIGNLSALEPEIQKLAAKGILQPVAGLRLLSPIANPVHVIAAPLNYMAHVEESSDPAINRGVHSPNFEGFATPIDKYGLFLKSQSGVVGAGEGVRIHFPGRRNDHEVELAVIIGRGGKDISTERAMDHVAGYCIGLDMTVRGTEDRSFRKSADSYTVLGPWIVTKDEIPNPDALDLSISVDGKLRQASNTSRLIVPIPDLIARASKVFKLYPGDVILTGTPEGVGEVGAGSIMHAELGLIGAMDVAVF